MHLSIEQIERLVLERHNSIANALKLHLSCTNPSRWWSCPGYWWKQGPISLNFNRISNIFIQENAFESVVCKKVAILSRPQCVKWQDVLLQDLVKSWSCYIRYSHCIVTKGIAEEQNSMKFPSKYNQCVWKCCMQSVVLFVRAQIWWMYRYPSVQAAGSSEVKLKCIEF